MVERANAKVLLALQSYEPSPITILNKMNLNSFKITTPIFRWIFFLYNNVKGGKKNN